jgi:peptidoglycan pentaglycine glycine transferase (the first glycine)
MDNVLQSEEWARFQEMSGRQVVRLGSGAYGFGHVLPVVGAYLYTPRFPDAKISHPKSHLRELYELAKKKQFAWIRIEPETEDVWQSCAREIDAWGENEALRLIQAPHDMQPRETFVVDISKTEKELLADMKAKTRYNVRLAEKKGVRIFMTREKKYQEIFWELIEATSRRQNILPHDKTYYEQMSHVFSEEKLSFFVAEYEGEVLAVNLVVFCGDTATYLHGGTSDRHRQVMAPVLLQWEQMREAKRRGCLFYDFGGVRSTAGAEKPGAVTNDWEGITRFKLGFSPNTIPTVFPGCYDMVVHQRRYALYARLRFLQQSLSMMKKFLRR